MGEFVITWGTDDANYQTIDDITRAGRSVIFLSLSIAFIFVGVKLITLFNLIIVRDQSIIKWRLITGILLISIPLLTNGIFNIFWIAFDLRKIQKKNAALIWSIIQLYWFWPQF